MCTENSRRCLKFSIEAELELTLRITSAIKMTYYSLGTTCSPRKGNDFIGINKGKIVMVGVYLLVNACKYSLYDFI